jgi:glycine/D-amino acid oxidase-like deaminating enzyme
LRVQKPGPCGRSAHVFQLGPGVGALMAELAATGATNLPIAPFKDRLARIGR